MKSWFLDCKFEKTQPMTSVKGMYENGQVKLLERVEGQPGQRVIVTFLDAEADWEDAELRAISLSQPNRFFEDYLNDEREDVYQKYAKKPD